MIPLFPGKNELDQINKIHNILGTPSPKILEEFRSHASHMEINFPPKEGTGIDKHIAHLSEDAKDVISKMLIYNQDERITCKEALNHRYFKDMNEEYVRRIPSPITKFIPADSAAGDKTKEEKAQNKRFLPMISKNPNSKNPSYTKFSMSLENKTLAPKSYAMAMKNPPYVQRNYKSYY